MQKSVISIYKYLRNTIIQDWFQIINEIRKHYNVSDLHWAFGYRLLLQDALRCNLSIKTLSFITRSAYFYGDTAIQKKWKIKISIYAARFSINVFYSVVLARYRGVSNIAST